MNQYGPCFHEKSVAKHQTLLLDTDKPDKSVTRALFFKKKYFSSILLLVVVVVVVF